MAVVVNDVPPVRLATKVYKEECMYCFRGPQTPDGIYVCLKTKFGLCKWCMPMHVQKTGNTQYVHWVRMKIKKTPTDSESPAKVTKLAIGIQGGFMEGEDVEYIDDWSVVIHPDIHKDIPLQDPCISDSARKVINDIRECKGALYEKLLEAETGVWDGEMRFVTKHANLKLPANPPNRGDSSKWSCEWENCGHSSNLWLNLFDGTTYCGRQYHDGSGGNNHALKHYEQCAKICPLVVKMGTMNADTADVYSYDEDDMVKDPNLRAHLLHYGIDMTKMVKTDQSMAELELDLNLKQFESSRIEETGASLIPVNGPGFTPMINIGNSCYLASTVQTLCQIPEFVHRFSGANAKQVFRNVHGDPTDDLNTQIAKLFDGLMSGDFAPKMPDDPKEITPDLEALSGIKPYFFRHILGQGHPEFCSKRQQDAAEYLQYLFDKIDALAAKEGFESPTQCCKFKIEEKLSVNDCKQVRYRTLESEVLCKLIIPLEAATNKPQVEEYKAKLEELKTAGIKDDKTEVVLPFIPFDAVLSAFRMENIPDFKSPITENNCGATKTHSFQNFPKYLFIQAAKYLFGNDGQPKKLEVELNAPDILDLENLRAKGVQPGEHLMEGETKPAPNINHTYVNELVSMGFPKDACVKAVYLTKNVGLEAATGWVMEHMGDADFATPHPHITKGHGKLDKGQQENPNVPMLTSMGFSEAQAKYALKQHSDPNSAAEWLFTNPDFNIPQQEMMDTSESTSSTSLDDGQGKYELIALISHIGQNTSGGHYVCHLYKNNRWIIFNDEKVAVSEKPPKQLAYVYLYRRIK